MEASDSCRSRRGWIENPHSSAITTDSVASQNTYCQSNVVIAMYRFIFPSCSPSTAHPVPCLGIKQTLACKTQPRFPLAQAGNLFSSDNTNVSSPCIQALPGLSYHSWALSLLHTLVAQTTVQNFAPLIVCPTSNAFSHKEALSKKESEEIRCGLQTEFLNDFLIRRADCQMLFALA